MPFLATRGRVRIGSLYSTDSSPNTLDSSLKRHIKRATAAWVGALLEEAGLVMTERSRPATVWLARRRQPLKQVQADEPCGACSSPGTGRKRNAGRKVC